jgi:hypothetical protein
MSPQHSRSGITHYLLHLLPPCGLIAVHRAFNAGWLLPAENAPIQARVRIIKQGKAVRANTLTGVRVIPATVNYNHRMNGLPFTGESFAGKCSAAAAGLI